MSWYLIDQMTLITISNNQHSISKDLSSPKFGWHILLAYTDSHLNIGYWVLGVDYLLFK